MTKPSLPAPSYFKRSLQFLSDYFLHSENKWKARALFLGCFLSTLTFVGLSLVLGWWCFPYLFAAFVAKDAALFLMGALAGVLIAGAMTGFNYLTKFLKNKLYLDWRSWLTKKMIGQYLNNKTNYLEISRLYPDVDNLDQRIQEDIDKVVDSFLELSLGFIENVSTLVLYTVLLSLVGGSLSFMLFGGTIIIPGFLVLVALAVGIASALIGSFINRSLSKLTNLEITSKSNLRTDLQQVKNSAEEIALEGGKKYFQQRLESEVDDVTIKTEKRLSIFNASTSFALLNSILQGFIIPFCAAAPLFFKGLITIEVFWSASFYFSQITNSLSWFIVSVETINKFKTSLARVIQLQDILDKNNEMESTNTILHTIGQGRKQLVVKNLNLNLHGTDTALMKGLNLTFTPGIHTLIQAPSGTGKSSLFKAIAKTWGSGAGEIIMPDSSESIYFLPQKPTLPDDTLRKVLAYPDGNASYSDSELIAALNAVNMAKLAGELDKNIGFKSLGEQQRIAFARILLRKPDWIFLDEATSSLDEPTEEQMYHCLKEGLPNATIISIAHRSTVRHHHTKSLFFNINKEKGVQVEEDDIFTNEQSISSIRQEAA
jgi:vitamin B12/bleomycin/antimicrobial peptide transport system ATP-binding/permease protein